MSVSRNLLRWIVPVLAFAGLAAAPAASRADFVFYTSNGDFQGGLHTFGLDDENVLFNGAGTISGPALTVTGRTNQSSQLIDITGIEDLITPASGQARVEASVGTYTTASITANDPMFALTSLSYQIKATNKTGGSFTLTATDQFGGTDSLTINSSPGNIFFGVIATNGEMLTVATITSSGNTIDDIRQIRVGLKAVPEPASLGLIGIGLIAVTFGGLRRKGRPIAA